MFYRLLRLQTDDTGAPLLVPMRQRSWRRRIVVGRELCVFESVSCRGVAWHELHGFATLQARRLAPFVRSGASAAVRNKQLMLWFWDQQDLDGAMQHAGGIHPAAQVVAETLMLDLPARQGELRLACGQGFDVLSLENSAIVRSRWESTAAGAAAAATLRSHPWARDHVGGSLATTVGGSAVGIGPRQALAAVAACTAIASGTYAAHGWGSLYGARERLQTLERDAESTMQQLQGLATLRSLEAQNRNWVENYRTLGGSFDFEAFLRALEPALASSNLVMKELELRNDEARLVLVSAGVEIDLPATLQTLGRIRGFENVALRDNADVRQATFTVQAKAYRSSPITGGPRTSP